MAEKCTNQSSRESYTTTGNSFKVPITSVSIITKIINVLMNLPKLPPPPIPKGLILIGDRFRPGLNSASLTAEILQSKSELGIPTSPLPSGGENIGNKMDEVMAEKVVKTLKTEAKVYGVNINQITLPVTNGSVTILPGVIKIGGGIA